MHSPSLTPHTLEPKCEAPSPSSPAPARAQRPPAYSQYAQCRPLERTSQGARAESQRPPGDERRHLAVAHPLEQDEPAHGCRCSASARSERSRGAEAPVREEPRACSGIVVRTRWAFKLSGFIRIKVAHPNSSRRASHPTMCKVRYQPLHHRHTPRATTNHFWSRPTAHTGHGPGGEPPGGHRRGREEAR